MWPPKTSSRKRISDVPGHSRLARHSAPTRNDSRWGALSSWRAPAARYESSELRTLLNQADARPEKTLNRPTGGPQTSGPRALVTSLAFHPTDPNVLLGTFQDGTTKWWNIAKDEEKLLRIERGMVFQGVFNHDGEWAATAHEDGIVRLWPLRASQPSPQMLRGHQGTVYTVAYSPDGTTIASGSSDGTARIWSQQPAFGRVPIGATVPPAAFGAGKASARASAAGQLILSYNNTDFTVRAPRNLASRPRLPFRRRARMPSSPRSMAGRISSALPQRNTSWNCPGGQPHGVTSGSSAIQTPR